MNIIDRDVLKAIKKYSYTNQRTLAELSGLSIGAVNAALERLTNEKMLDSSMRLTEKALEEFKKNSPRNAVILAAGYGSRMIPINYSVPKALLEVNKETLIERLIRQLHKAGVNDISIVVGHLKEAFEYLIDLYGVKLIINLDYYSKNNLHSLRLAADKLSNTYIVPCDIWCAKSPFDKDELYSWYSVSNRQNSTSEVRINRKRELVFSKEMGNTMIGIAYLCGRDSSILCSRLKEFDSDPANSELFWESALYQGGKMMIHGKLLSEIEFFEINTYEQLRELDDNSPVLRNEIIGRLASILDVQPQDITDIQVLKKGMTNRSFIFSCKGNRFIMRIPGEGTNKLINRQQEAEVYKAISGKGICDDVIFIDPESGYKISSYIEGARVCDPSNRYDVERCIEKLRSFHKMRLSVGHRFDLFKQITFYDRLRSGAPSIYKDHADTTRNVFSLKEYIDAHALPFVLTHIDAVPDNFIFSRTTDGKEALQLTDWEYAGMQDPHVDIAMFSIYSLYDRKQADDLIDLYFEGACDKETRIKIYCYISVCGLLWSNWCEYKRLLGVDFGEYALRQYRYAKEFYRIAKEMMKDE